MASDKVRVTQNPEGNKVFTLCGTNNCCPTVTVDKEGNHVIRDDFGGSVVLTQEQFELLPAVK